MFENLIIVVVIIVVLWLVSFGVYFYSTRQQQGLTTQIDDLKNTLDREGQDAKN